MDREKKDDEGKDCNSNSSESQNMSQSNNSLGCLPEDVMNNSLGCLPEDVMFNILTRLPAEWLHKSARLTCKAWAAMIRRSDFVETHLLQAKAGIFLQSTRHPYGAHFLEVKGNGDFGVVALSPQLPGQYLNSCDGLILLSQVATRDLHVVNPVTKQTLNAPKFPYPILGHPRAAIVRVPRTGEFKLFASLVQTQPEVCYSHWHVLRLRKDAYWIKFASEPGDLFRCTPIYCGGNDLYWITQDHIIVMDVDKETFRKFSLPWEDVEWSVQFFNINNHMASAVFIPEDGYQIHIFEADSGEWRLHHEMGTFDYYDYHPREDDSDEASHYLEISRFLESYVHYSLQSFGGGINQEVIFKLSVQPPPKASLFSYNVETIETREIDVLPEGLFDGAFEEGSFKVGLHTNSLASC